MFKYERVSQLSIAMIKGVPIKAEPFRIQRHKGKFQVFRKTARDTEEYIHLKDESAFGAALYLADKVQNVVIGDPWEFKP